MLPQALPSFVGRESERRTLTELLSNPEVRLVTIHGPPGAGKTRLALQSASEHLGKARFEDGIFFVPLEAVTDPIGVPIALLEAMDLGLEGPEPALVQVERQLGAKQLLFVLDNFEHLIEARGSLTDVLKACPNVSLVTTSRERLNLEAEWVLTLEGFPVPAETQAFGDAGAAHALQLFIQRARQARLDFELTDDNLPHVRAICRLVDGFPLGLELAAAWVGLSPLEVIAQELGRDVMDLATPLNGVHERHQSIRAAFEHSWRLLSAIEQGTLRQLRCSVAASTVRQRRRWGVPA
jgi:predicted ATPase